MSKTGSAGAAAKSVAGKAIDFHPKLFSALRHYTPERLKADIIAGIVVGIVALPLAIAFGIASGVSPTIGLITAIIGGFMVSFFGGNSVQIGGPTGAFIVIVYNIIAQFGLHGLAIATFMAGVLLVLMGLFRLGTIIKFIPYPIVVGFTAGIALTIFSTQINDFFGLGLRDIPGQFIPKWGLYFRSLGNISPAALVTSLVALLIIVLMPKISKRLPGALIAIIVVTAASYFMDMCFDWYHVETIGDRFGTMATDIPTPHGFTLSMATINMLLPSAFTIAVLGAIESLLSATVRTCYRFAHKQQHRADRAGYCQYHSAFLWRHTRYRRYRPYNDQYHQRRPHPRGRYRARAGAPADIPLRHAAYQLCASRMPCFGTYGSGL